MLKRILCLLTLCALMACSFALAEPRYPAQSGVTTDSAAVLSVKLLEDLRTLDKRLNKAEAPRLYVVTVHFLDAARVQDYADALFTRWELPDDAVLLLRCVGEESCAIAAGSTASRLLSDAALEDLLAVYLSESFLAQEYDAAVAAFARAYAAEISRACGVNIKVEDLFRSTSSGILGSWAGSQRTQTATGDSESFLTREDKASGFSFLKVIVIVALLVLIFGTFRKGQKMRRPPEGEDAPPAEDQADPDKAEKADKPAGHIRPEKPQKPEKPEKPKYPVYFRPHEKKPTPQYFHPRKPK